MTRQDFEAAMLDRKVIGAIHIEAHADALEIAGLAPWLPRQATIAGDEPSDGTMRLGGHIYEEDGTSDCRNGCGCWMGSHRSGGPDGVDPFGDCPKAGAPTP